MLNQYRDGIDKIDKEIEQLLEKRFELTKAVGEYKKKNKLDIQNTNRENEVFENIRSLNLENEKYIIEIYKYIMGISKEQQSE